MIHPTIKDGINPARKKIHTPLGLQFMKAWQWQAESDKRYVLSFKEFGLKCFDINKSIELGSAHGRDWVLLTEESRLPNCDKAPAFTVQSR